MPRKVRNIDMTDRELLTVIHAAAGGGFASSTDIGVALGFTVEQYKVNGKKYSNTPANKVGARLNWMRRYGFLESDDPDLSVPFTEPGARDTRWRLTNIGHDLMGGKLSQGVQNAIDKMEPGAQLLLMRSLSRKSYVEARYEVAAAVRREWKHNEAQRPR